jgi:Cu+-exporting ATPase
VQQIQLTIGGMTCASCAARVERRLNRVAGVRATVNYATETASVEYSDTVTPADLIRTVQQTGYTAQAPRPAADHRLRLWLSAALTVPVVVLGMTGTAPALALLLALPVVTYGGWPLHRAAALALRHGASTMDTLVSLGTLVAYGWSVYALFAHADSYAEVAAVVTTFVLAGRALEARAKRRAGSAVRALLGLAAKDVAVIRNNTEVRVPIAELAVGDRFVVRPGEKIATDGIVHAGQSAVDISLVTGESVPVEVGPGDAVIGASINANGRLVVAATRIGADTRLAQITRLVEQAQSGKAAVQRLADRVSAVFVPAVIALALATLAGWLLTGHGAGTAIRAAVAVLVVACPCALGLATPTALLVGTGRGAQLGVLIRGPQVLENTRRVDTIVLDKTGTVTTGELAVTAVTPEPGIDRDTLLRYAAAVEAGSEHPIGRAVRAAAPEVEPAEHIVATPGQGIAGTVDGHRVTVGRSSIVDNDGAGITVAVGWDGTHRGRIELADTVRESSRRAVAALRALGLHPVLLTGDSAAVARNVATEVGIDDVVAGVLPEGKAEAVQRLQRSGRTVAMVGDGVNDAAAIAAADLGLAMGAGTDVAIEAADVTLVRGDLTAAVDAVRLARRTLRTIQANLVWAFAYNVAALPVAAAGLLNPMVAGGAMALSSVFVVTNSLRLRNFQPTASEHRRNERRDGTSTRQPMSSSR